MFPGKSPRGGHTGRGIRLNARMLSPAGGAIQQQRISA
jgi:hypothetical protein